MLTCQLCGISAFGVAAIAMPEGTQTRCIDFLGCWRRLEAQRKATGGASADGRDDSAERAAFVVTEPTGGAG